MKTPSRPDEISPEWLHHVIGVDVSALHVVPVGLGYGMTGQVARLDPLPLVAKFAPIERGGRLEARFYAEVAPALGLPTALWSGEVEEVTVLIMQLVAGRQGDVMDGCSAPEAAALLRSIGQVHRWGRDHRPDWVSNWPSNPSALQERLAQRTGEFLERRGRWVSPRAQGIIEDLGNQLPRVYARLSAATRTLIHADLHLDNVLFTPAPVILDWQTARWGPAVVDVARVFIEGPTAAQRRGQERLLIDAWKQAADVTIDVMPDLRAALLWTLANVVSAYARERNDLGHRGLALLEHGIRNACAAVLEV